MWVSVSGLRSPRPSSAPDPRPVCAPLLLARFTRSVPAVFQLGLRLPPPALRGSPKPPVPLTLGIRRIALSPSLGKAALCRSGLLAGQVCGRSGRPGPSRCLGVPCGGLPGCRGSASSRLPRLARSDSSRLLPVSEPERA
uniref:Uncharacterized protein n=1 Tax=Rousettus aegyptiacus TaxID=9407 RepID=A0A7J8D765_ROUAE|nr:hypothetical protein HJG63_008811 [Rousettus aegyptiacus]